MRLFVFEYVTGGGMLHQALPPSLVAEADLMLRALLHDLADAPVELLTTRDPRLPPVEGVRSLGPLSAESVEVLYARGLAACDAAWPTAPETGGVLERLGRATLAANRTLVGCHPDAVALTASKSRTAERLSELGVRGVPTFVDPDRIPPVAGPWVVKPDDGAGAADTRRVGDWRAARDRLRACPGRYIAQPWITGEALSLSLLVCDGSVEVIACNRQHLELRGEALHLVAIEVNVASNPGRRWGALARALTAGIPGLSGYVGVDLIETRDGPVVVEINPRLTTSYCGLREATGRNLAARLLGFGSDVASRATRMVTLSLATASAH